MGKIRDGGYFEEWLYRLDAADEARLSPVLTMRMALRVLPGLCVVGADPGGDDWRGRLALFTARATTALWLSCIDATNAGRLKNIAFLASARAASIASDLQNKGGRDRGDIFSLAPAGVVYTTYAIHDATTDRPPGEIAYTACSALSAIVGHELASERQPVFWAALDADIALIEAGTATQALAVAPVWGATIDLKSAQPELKALLEKLRGVSPAGGARWDAWVDWYRGRLAGGMPANCTLAKRPHSRR